MKKSRTIRWIVLIAVVGGAGYFGWQRYYGPEVAAKAEAAQKAAARRPAIPVSISPVEKTDFPVYLTGLGTVQAFNTVVVRTRVDGQIDKIAFQEGQIGQPGRPAGRDRSAAVPGVARPGQGQEGAGRGQSRQRQSRPAALHQARRVRHAPADRHPALHGRAADRADRGRRRRHLQRPDPARLHPGEIADLRRGRPAPGRHRQHRQRLDPNRHRHGDPDRADHRDFHRAGRATAVYQRRPEGCAAQDDRDHHRRQEAAGRGKARR